MLNVKSESELILSKLGIKYCGIISVCAGCIVLLGWVIASPILTTFAMGTIAVAPSTALEFILFGIIFFTYAKYPGNRKVEIWGNGISLFCFLLAAAFFILSMNGIYLEGEHLWFNIDTPESSRTAHMSPITAFSFLLIAASLLITFLSTKHPGRMIVSFLLSCFLVCFCTFMFLTSFFTAPIFEGINIVPPAKPTLLLLSILSVVLSTLLFQRILLRKKNNDLAFTREAYILLTAFLMITVALVTTGYLYFQKFSEQSKKETGQQLLSITNLKVGQLYHYRNERLGDADFLFKNRTFSKLVKAYLSNPGNSEIYKELFSWLENYQYYNQYEYIFLADVNGKMNMAIPDRKIPMSSITIKRIPEILKTKKPIFEDFLRNENDGKIYLALLVPILDYTQNNKVISIAILRIDPEKFVYPYTRLNSTTNKSLVSFLIQRNGNSVVYLGDDKFNESPILNAPQRYRGEYITSIKVFLDKKGIVSGADIHGVSVLAAVDSIPGSPWFLVTKIDNAEFYAPVRERFWQMMILLVSFLLLMGTVVAFIWKQQHSRLYHEKSVVSSALVASEIRFRRLFESAKDGILLLDAETGVVLDVNSSLVEMLGYAGWEFIGKTIWELSIAGTPVTNRETFNEFQQKESLYFEDLSLEKADGHTINVELVGNVYLADSQRVMQCNIRDITERKRSEEKLINLNRVYSVISQINQAIVRTKDKQILFNEACAIAIEFGKLQMAWIGLIDSTTCLIEPVASAGNVDGYLTSFKKASSLDIPQGRGPTGTSIREGKPVCCNDIENNPIMKLWKDEAIKRGYRSSIALPIRMFGKIIGAFTLYAKTAHYFDDEEIQLLDEVTNDISFALQSIETERRQQQAEEALRERELLFWDMFNNAPIGYHELDTTGRIVQVNQTELDMLGYAREEMVGRYIWEFIEDSERSKERVMGKLLGTFPAGVSTERRYYKKDKTQIVFLLVEDAILKNERGQITGMRSTMQDISERKKIEESLNKSHEDLFKLSEQVPGVIYQYRLYPDGRSCFPYSSSGMNDIYEYSPAEVQADATPVFGRLHPDDVKRVSDLIFKSARTLEHFYCEFRVILPRQGLRWRYSDAKPERMEDGGTLWYGIIYDITDRKLTEQELIASKEKAEEMSQVKSNFLANMSHELRTPLIGILGYSEILGEELENEEHRKMIKTISSSGERLKTTLNMILDLSKVEARKIGLQKENQNVVPLVKNCIDLYSGAIQKSELYLHTDIADEQLYANIDQRLFADIVNNLLKNAIVYTRAGGITVTVDERNIDAQEWICVSVADTGIGIAKSNFGLIFEEFRQVSEGLSRGFEGTGLGLTLTKKYVELMHGIISVESELGVGSTFMVRFPLMKSIERGNSDAVVSASGDREAMKEYANLPLVLFVEDDDVTRRFVDRVLRAICTIDFAKSGTKAIELVAQKKYDCILMDINLGRGMDGTEVTKEIRMLPQYAVTPIIAVTAFAMEGDKADFLAAGCTDYISKPFTKQELLNVVMKSLKKK